MDSLDSSSTTSIDVTSASGSTADHDGILSSSASLAKDSLVLYQSGKYAECVDVLMQLLQKKEGDPKVIHNIALAKFFRSGCSDPKKFLEALFSIKKNCEDLAHSSRELGTISVSGNNTVSGSKISSTGHQASMASCIKAGYSDQCDTSLATLNMAIVLYHLHDYSKAMTLLEPLFQNIEPLDEGTAVNICLLLLDLAVCTQDAMKYADVISYVGKAFGVGITNQAGNGCIGPHQPPNINLASKTSLLSSNAAASADDLDADSAANASEDTLSRTFSDEGIDYDNLFSSMDMSSSCVKYQKHQRLPALNDLSRTLSDRFDSKLNAPLFKVQLLLLIRNLKLAKRELKLAMNIAHGRDSSIALLLKSQLELKRGNYIKAEKLLKASNSQQETGNTIMFDNNMGCIFFQWGKFQASGVFFHKALLGCSSLRKEKPRNLTAFFCDKTFLIMYNSGLQYLACGKPDLAAQCLQKASLIFYNRPLLWVRLAECCIMALEKEMVRSFEVAVIGQGKWRHLGVINGASAEGHLRNSGEKVKPGNDKSAPNLSMSFARQCLWKALALVQRFESKSVNSSSSMKPALGGNVRNEGLASSKMNHNDPSSAVYQMMSGSMDGASLGETNANGDMKAHKGGSAISLAEYEDVCRREYLIMKQAILADLAFVELELGNPVVALTWARSLLQIPECSKIYTFLGRIYAAESLCLLNRPAEAAEQLSVYFSRGIANAELPYSKEDYERWYSQWLVNRMGSRASPELSEGDGFEECHEGVFWKPEEVRGPLWQDNVLCKPEEAEGALYVNLAAMCAMQGQLDLASGYSVKALSLLPNSREANLMVAYLDIKQGRIGAARSRLRRCTRVRFVSCGGWRSKGSL